MATSPGTECRARQQPPPTLRTCLALDRLILDNGYAALSVKHVSRRWSGFGAFARQAPYFSGALILLVGVYLGYQGLQALA